MNSHWGAISHQATKIPAKQSDSSRRPTTTHGIRTPALRAVLRIGCMTLFVLFFALSAFSQPTIPMEWFYFPPPNFETTYGSFPVADTTNLLSVPVGLICGMDNALIIDTTNQTPAFLEYAVMDTNWVENISYDPGTILLCFAPNWASVSQGGTGPGDTAMLIAGGDFSTNSPNGLFEIYIDAAGSNVFIGGLSNGVSVTYASAPISWTSNTFHQLGFEYKSTSNRRSPGTEIYLDSVLAATGGAVSIVPALGADSNGFCTNVFMVGSDGNGLEQARGAFWNMITWSDEYGGWYTNEWSVTSNALVAWQATLGGGGFGAMMGMGGLGSLNPTNSSCGCISNTTPHLANMTTANTPGLGMTLTFTIEGGTNGVGYDIFTTPNLIGAPANLNWAWLGRGTNCATYTVLNQTTNASYYILGGPQVSTDGSGMTTALESLIPNWNSAVQNNTNTMTVTIVSPVQGAVLQ